MPASTRKRWPGVVEGRTRPVARAARQGRSRLHHRPGLPIPSAIRASWRSTARRSRRLPASISASRSRSRPGFASALPNSSTAMPTASRAIAGAPAAWSRSSCRMRPSACASRTCTGGDGEDGRAISIDGGRSSGRKPRSWSRRSMPDELTDPMVGDRAAALSAVPRARRARLRAAGGLSTAAAVRARRSRRGAHPGFSAEEIESTIEDGLIGVTCEFCSTTYRFEATARSASSRMAQFRVRTSPGESNGEGGDCHVEVFSAFAIPCCSGRT